MILENEPFLTELSNMFAHGRKTGKSLRITMKKYDGNTRPKKSKKDDKSEKKDMCLIKAKIEDRKISTVVQQKDINRFQLAYSNLIKGNMYGLSKKRN